MNNTYIYVDIMTAFITNTKKHLIYYKLSKNIIYYGYIHYYNNFYTQGQISYIDSLYLLLNHHTKKEILDFHKEIIEILKTEVIKYVSYNEKYFLYLCDCYDVEFKQRLSKEIYNIKTIDNNINNIQSILF